MDWNCPPSEISQKDGVQLEIKGFVLVDNGSLISFLPSHTHFGRMTFLFSDNIYTFLLQMSYFCGLVVNEGINWVLKHIIQEHRPLRCKTFYIFRTISDLGNFIFMFGPLEINIYN